MALFFQTKHRKNNNNELKFCNVSSAHAEVGSGMTSCTNKRRRLQRLLSPSGHLENNTVLTLNSLLVLHMYRPHYNCKGSGPLNIQFVIQVLINYKENVQQYTVEVLHSKLEEQKS